MNIYQGKRNTVLFGLAFLLSAFGYEFMVFVMTVHIYDLTGSALNVGLFTALTFLPRLFSPYYGSIADRYPRGRIFSVAAMGIALGIFLVAGSKGIAWTYTIWFFVSILLMTVMNVRPAIMTEILPKENYLHGNAIMLVSLNAARLAAPLIGGAVALKWNIVSLGLVTMSFAFFYATIVSTHSLRDQATPIEYRGRVYGFIVAILTPAALVSFLAGSYLASLVGVEKVLIGAGMLALVSMAVLEVKQAGPAPSVTAD